MKQPTFLEGVAVACAASIAGGVLYTTLTLILAGGWVLRLLIAGIGLAYVVYLLSRSRERVGRITTLALWAGMAGALWLLNPPLSLYVLVHAGLIWLIRSLYFYAGVLSTLIDLGLSGFSLAAAIWAATQTGSLFLSLWCFFLVQALFVAIPSDLSRKAKVRQGERTDQDRFQCAYRTAEAALRKLSSVH